MPFCAKCGARLSEVASFCSKCETATKGEAVDLADSITDTLRAAGREIETAFKTAGKDTDKTFGELRDDVSELGGPFCPECGDGNPHDARFCLACGGKIPSGS